MSQNESLRGIGQDARSGESGVSGPRPGETATWNEERIIQLRQLWEQGLSASSIGRVLGVTKNAVVGKAHRLKLSSRPSPIRKGSKPPVRRATVLARPTLPSEPMVSLSSDSDAASALAKTKIVPSARQSATKPAAASSASRFAPAPGATLNSPATPDRATPVKEPPLAARAPTPGGLVSRPTGASRRNALSSGRTTACVWPIGDPGDPDFHFCEAESLPGKSYCAEHCAKAYVTKSRPDSEAA
ncbi:MAG: GcrA family cell cycle regulator [Rhodospirillales bacterium]